MTIPSARRLSAVIVDDEPPARRTLELLLARESDVDIVATVRRRPPTAIDAIVRLQPDVVFLDIQIPGGDGFEVLRLLPADRRFVVAFVTGRSTTTRFARSTRRPWTTC